jgi:beta-glucosidase
LRGFVKVTLDPGASQTVRLTLDRRDWAFWDVSLHAWHAEAGEFDMLVGPSSADIRRRARVRLEASQTFGGPRRHAPALSLASPLATLLARPAARAIIEAYLPGMATGVDLGMVGGFSLEQIARFAPDRVPEAALTAIAAALAMLEHAG